MKREAILHIPMSNYAHGIDETHMVLRFRCARGDLSWCNVYYGDTGCRVTPIIFTKVPMQIVASDSLFDYYEAKFESLYNRIYYYFEFSDGKETLYYYADRFRTELVDDRSEYYKLPYNNRSDIVSIPEWVKEAVVYNIFPDSFATSKRYISKKGLTREIHETIGKDGLRIINEQITTSKLGGTIQGITQNVDYLANLGINCIYINPIFAAGEYHKYDTIDYFTIDPCFGTNEDFKEMVETCHQSGIRVIIDGVFNHCGWNFFAFNDVVKKGEQSLYKDWFYRLEFPVIKPDNWETIPSYECFGYERLMPKLNTANKEVQEYLLRVCRYWIEEYDIDGWRLDVASEVNDEFWREFRKEAKACKKDCFIIGEVWENASHWLDGSQFDSSMNYDMRKFCMYFFAKNEFDSYEFDGCVTDLRMRYRENVTWGQLNLLDSHDVSRFYSVCKEQIERFQLAVLFQMTFIGVPSIFYGDEQEIAGILEEDYRQPMRWNTTGEMYEFYKDIIALRKASKAIKQGNYRTIYAPKDSGLYIYERTYENEKVVVILNSRDQEVEIPYSFSMDIVKQKKYDGNKIGAFGYAVLRLSTPLT